MDKRITFSLPFLGSTFKDVLGTEWGNEISKREYDVYICGR